MMSAKLGSHTRGRNGRVCTKSVPSLRGRVIFFFMIFIFSIIIQEACILCTCVYTVVSWGAVTRSPRPGAYTREMSHLEVCRPGAQDWGVGWAGCSEASTQTLLRPLPRFWGLASIFGVPWLGDAPLAFHITRSSVCVSLSVSKCPLS